MMDPQRHSSPPHEELLCISCTSRRAARSSRPEWCVSTDTGRSPPSCRQCFGSGRVRLLTDGAASGFLATPVTPSARRIETEISASIDPTSDLRVEAFVYRYRKRPRSAGALRLLDARTPFAVGTPRLDAPPHRPQTVTDRMCAPQPETQSVDIAGDFRLEPRSMLLTRGRRDRLDTAIEEITENSRDSLGRYRTVLSAHTNADTTGATSKRDL
jgi:hypothetical protein